MGLDAQQQVEFSRLVSPETLSEDPSTRRIAATESERRALAARFGLLSLERLEATLHLRRPGRGRLIRVKGHFEAEVTQACVVTLEPVVGRVSENVALVFSQARPDRDVSHSVEVPVEGEDAPEEIGPEGLDLGEAVAQLLALALEPYPRVPGVELSRTEWRLDDSDDAPALGAFAQLEVLKPKP